MSKEVLKHICTSARKDSYSWDLYFFKIDKRAKQPFKANKVRFKNNSYLLQYAKNLLNATEIFRLIKSAKCRIMTAKTVKYLVISCY